MSKAQAMPLTKTYSYRATPSVFVLTRFAKT